ncbi:hypothetical protein M407DRAFT_98654 [Tulasnella calospora MUT 4182]|uniref:Uncharacterized protein n=1 Tax=Tulasnella calospora MUT 4182 TaxID=1051891 RepID=A0A0C3QGR1_9AGAM|nr:hypothetical protein M407DRAFT_98654 [Tulasnella calospora MUT 4182]
MDSVVWSKVRAKADEGYRFRSRSTLCRRSHRDGMGSERCEERGLGDGPQGTHHINFGIQPLWHPDGVRRHGPNKGQLSAKTAFDVGARSELGSKHGADRDVAELGNHGPNSSPARVVPIIPSLGASITIIIPGTVTSAVLPSPIIISFLFPTVVSVIPVPCAVALSVPLRW